MSGTTSLTIKTEPTGADAPPKPPETKPDGNGGTTPPDPNRPAWLPEKFKTAEEMAAAYKELEQKQSQPTTQNTSDLSTSDAAKAALAAQGLDFQKLSAEYNSNGKLSDESMNALKAKGFSETQVKQFIDGQEALAREGTKGVYDSVGGQERFNKLVEFARTNLTPTEQAAYNAAVASGNYDTVKLMLAGLNVKFEATFGKDGNLTTGKPPVVNADVYENFQDYRNAIKDPRYQKDRNYRAAVDAKLERSTFYKRQTSHVNG